jgi:hypothetical protein
MYPKVGVKGDREDEKKERKTADNYEVHHICVGTKHKETC